MKKAIHERYLQLVNDKIDVFRDMISGLTIDAQNDAKGSAGDKHETALSMMHIEQEKLNTKLSECLTQKAVLEKINPENSSNRVVLGSLVKANGIHLFVSAALPKINIDGTNILALSPQSPLGTELLGHEAGHSFEIHGSKYTIESVL
ncbi:MAG: hypothetical protein EOO50_15100 [Flavobacterium sp.]|uniref:hypothetical protein n=1 Tax=Flavobacterium sp. TaxID=239 RepID=UPI001200DFB1|nr:hypothetical protein [Flavobacterium sp.]RZJ65101.1 MAG: hypothetical protein EOO50_15100 [Flavobacterium sp.]